MRMILNALTPLAVLLLAIWMVAGALALVTGGTLFVVLLIIGFIAGFLFLTEVRWPG